MKFGTKRIGIRMSNYHTPVLLQEVIQGLQVTAGKRFIDATLGGGGHTKKILEMGAEVLAIDEDIDAIEENERLIGPHCRIVQGNFIVSMEKQVFHKHKKQGLMYQRFSKKR